MTVQLPKTPITFSYTKEDFISAAKLGARLTSKWWMTRLAFIAVVVAALFLLSDDVMVLAVYITVLVLGIGVFLFLFTRFIVPRRAEKQFDQQPLAHLETVLTITDEGIKMQSPRGESHLLWQDFHSWRANDETVLLYASPAWYWVLPARLEAMGMPIDALKQMLACELGPQKS